MIKKKIIRKEKKLSTPPNLVDYQKTYREYTWKEAEKEIFWFPGKKINAAYNALDRNALGPRKNKVALYWESEKGEKKKFTFLELYFLANHFLATIGARKSPR